jgi:putative Holliday junction resolvase
VAHDREVFTTSSKAISHSPDYANLSLSEMQTREWNLNQETRVIGLDAGSVRTGVAMADASRTLASPYLIIHTNPINGFAARLRTALADYAIELVVVGLPLTLRGTEGPSAELARQLAALVEAEFACPVEFMDERFSSQRASQARVKPGGRKQQHREHLDDRAAVEILQGWLDYRQTDRSGPVFD